MDVAAANPEIRRRIPSFRNREVFQEVVVKDRSKTEVGTQFGLSQPRGQPDCGAGAGLAAAGGRAKSPANS